MKHEYWWLTRPDESVRTIHVAPEIGQETADKLVEAFWPGCKIEPGVKPTGPVVDQNDDSHR